MALNSEQQKYVECMNDSLVIACPGSGKTKSICSKISFLLDRNQNPRDHFAVLTFTNRAADEIYDRISLINHIPDNLWLGTIHSFCLEWILKSFQNEISDLAHGFTIADDFTQKKILDDLKKKYNINYSEGINTKFSPTGNLLETSQSKRLVLQEYHQELQKQGLIDYDQILYKCYLFLKENHQASKLIAKIFRWIIVDEYQDTQELQYQIIGLLKIANTSLKISFVGDPDQAIYSSLGGVAYQKSELETICNTTFTPHTLAGCYRSSQKIIDYYSHYKSQNVKIFSLASTSSTSTIKYDKTVSRDILPSKIIAILRQEISQGVPENEICVLSPQWDSLQTIASELKKIAPDLSLDAPGISPISKNRENVWYPLSKILLTESSPENFRKRMKWARESLKFLAELSDERSTISPLSFLELTNTSRSPKSKGTDFLEDSIKSILINYGIDLTSNQLVADQLKKFIEGTLKRINDHSIDDDVNTFKSYYRESEGIVLSTFHGVKGEEYEVVIATGLLKGKVPHWDCIINTSHLQDSEANKLLYVVASRAKTRLYLFSETGYKTKKNNPYEPTPQLFHHYAYDK